MLNLPGPLGRPVPIQELAPLRTAVPIPFNRLPELRDPSEQISFRAARAAEVLSGGEQSFHQERRFHQVSAVVEHAEDRHRLARASVHVMRPGAVIALRVFQELDDLRQPLEGIHSLYQTAVHLYSQQRDTPT